MPKAFQHQDSLANFVIPRSVATPQHGQKPDKNIFPKPELRSFQPRTGH